MSRLVIPADVDRDDILVAGLTARQLAWLAAGGAVLIGLWSISRPLLAIPLFLMLAAPLATVVVVLAMGRRDGLSADHLLFAWLRQHRGGRRLVPAPEGIAALPRWAPHRSGPAPVAFPVAGIGYAGLVDLDDAGIAIVCQASSLNFGLRTAAEQEAVVAAVGRWLNSLDGPVQVVVRSERVDVGEMVAAVRDDAPGLPHPALEAAAVDHAAFLADLAGKAEVLRRVVFLVFRHLGGPGGAERLGGRAEEAARSLAGAGITVRRLEADEVIAALGRTVNPDRPPRPAGMARPGEIIRWHRQ